jgi:hypothetical protein
MKKTTGMLLAAVLLVTNVGAAASRKPRDRTPPRVGFTTPNNAVLFGVPDEEAGGATIGPGSWARVEGTASDAGGVRTIETIFVRCTTASSNERGTTCMYVGPGLQTSDLPEVREGSTIVRCTSGRKRCAWEVRVPLVPGDYLVGVEARDFARNRSGDLVHITVV